MQLTAEVGAGNRYIYLTDTRSAIHRYQVVPIIRWIYSGDDIPKEEGGRGPGAEGAHEFGLQALRGLYDLGFGLRERGGHEYLDAKGFGVEVCTLPYPMIGLHRFLNSKRSCSAITLDHH